MRLGQRTPRTLGQHARASTLFLESLAVRRELGDRRGIAECCEALATEADARRKPADASRLLGAADALRQAISAPLPPSATQAREQLVERLRQRLGASSYEDRYREGAELPLDQVVRGLLGSDRAPASDRRRSSPDRLAVVATADEPAADPRPALLSPREREVSALVARGLSNREIAAALVVTEGSAANYVKRVLAKLGFRSRAQVAVWAITHILATAATALD